MHFVVFGGYEVIFDQVHFLKSTQVVELSTLQVQHSWEF